MNSEDNTQFSYINKTSNTNFKKKDVEDLIFYLLICLCCFYLYLNLEKSKQNNINENNNYYYNALKNEIIQNKIIVKAPNDALENKYKEDIVFLQSCLDDTSIESFERNEEPKLSLIIVINNKGIYLNRLLKSIQKQEIKEIEIIVVDDCSTDNNNNSKLLEEYEKIDKRIVVIKNEKKEGFLYSYSIGILVAKSNYILLINEEDMLLSNLKEMYEISRKNGKDINDFSYIQGTLNNFDKEIKMGDKEFKQPFIGEMIFFGNYGITFITNKIMKTDILKEAVRTLDDEYLYSKLLFHSDTILFISIFSQAQSYKSFNELFIQFHIIDYNIHNEDINGKYNELFKSTIYLFQYISELKCNSKEIYNKHINFACQTLILPLNICNDRKLIVDWDTLNMVVNNTLNNKDLSEKNKKEINRLLNIIKKKNTNYK